MIELVKETWMGLKWAISRYKIVIEFYLIIVQTLEILIKVNKVYEIKCLYLWKFFLHYIFVSLEAKIKLVSKD